MQGAVRWKLAKMAQQHIDESTRVEGVVTLNDGLCLRARSPARLAAYLRDARAEGRLTM